jgi:gluconate kinase
MASLLLVTGPPGAGKSTVAGMLVERFDHSVLVEGDSFFGFLRRGAVAPWLPEARGQNEVVTRAAASAVGQYVSGGYTAVSVERCLARVTAREGHGFTDEAATRKMHGEFARAEIDQRHVLVDPSDEVQTVVDRILEAFAGGELAYRTSSP